MHIKVSKKADKARRLKAEKEKPMAVNMPKGYGRPLKPISPETVRAHFEQGYRSGEDWKPGRVSNKFRENYDQIRWDK